MQQKILRSMKRKRKRSPFQKYEQVQMFVQLWQAFLCASALCLVIVIVCVSVVRIEGYSMTPFLNHRDWVLVNKYARLKRFSLIYFKHPDKNEWAVRRVIGLPEEHIFFRDEQLYVNEQAVSERFLAQALLPSMPSTRVVFTEDFTLEMLNGQRRIPKDYYLVLGDNRPYATDSRHYGLIPKQNIVGVVAFRLFPFDPLQPF